MDITSMGTDYASSIAANAVADEKTSSLKNKDLKNASDEELMDACKQFEEYFMEQIFKTALKSTTALSGESDGPVYLDTMKDYIQDQYAKEISTSASNTGQVGFAQELFNQMKRTQGITAEEALQKIAAANAPAEEKAEENAGEKTENAAEEVTAAEETAF